MGYKALVKVFNEEPYHSNGLVFATSEEAEAYAHDLAGRWALVETFKVEQVEEEPNYRWDGGKLVALA